ncbi:helix-turn-helix domain-containing protein [Tundrisphaera sp. TA3]|uniref:helix-turn-helix domain-containing protein n=1 Tax=Tundrisphaera sp. TA3 TaxID=3435775 RepID=UPI003EBB93B4
MIRITLTDDEVTRLEQAFRTSDNLRLRPRAQAVLMASRGRPHPQIAQDLAVNQRTLQRWLNAYNRGGLDALVPGKAKGATPRLTDDLAPVLQRWVIDGPAKQGLDRANWTHEELADHLRKTKGISVKKSAMQAFCRKHEIRPYRPGYRFLRGDPAKQAEAKVELAALKKGRTKESSSC